MRLIAFVAAIATLLHTSNASSLTPPVLPLIVRNPYLSTWLGNAREEPWTTWPMFWTGNSVGPIFIHPRSIGKLMVDVNIDWLLRLSLRTRNINNLPATR